MDQENLNTQSGEQIACSRRTARAPEQGLSRLLLSLVVLLGIIHATASSAQEVTDGNTLEKMSYARLPGDRVQITLKFAAPPPEPLSFTIENPARIALDFPQIHNGLEERTLEVGLGAVHSVSAAEANGRTRTVVNLFKMVDYQTKTSGNELVLTLQSGTSSSSSLRSAVAPARAGVGVSWESSTPPVRTIEDIDFRRGKAGEGRVFITLSDPNTPVDLREQGGKIYLDFYKVSLPEQLQRRLDVTDFATPVETIDVVSQGNNVRMAIAAVGEYEQLAYQSDNLFTVELRRVEEEVIAGKR